jgi:hypothetical protein
MPAPAPPMLRTQSDYAFGMGMMPPAPPTMLRGDASEEECSVAEHNRKWRPCTAVALSCRRRERRASAAPAPPMLRTQSDYAFGMGMMPPAPPTMLRTQSVAWLSIIGSGAHVRLWRCRAGGVRGDRGRESGSGMMMPAPAPPMLRTQSDYAFGMGMMPPAPPTRGRIVHARVQSAVCRKVGRMQRHRQIVQAGRSRRRKLSCSFKRS